MGVYQKYKDKNGRPCGPWFVKYPYQRDFQTEKIKYKIKKSSHSRRLAEKFLIMKENEFFRKDEAGLAIEDPRSKITFSELIDWYLEQELVKAKKSYQNDVQRAGVLRKMFGRFLADEISRTRVKNYQIQRKQEKTWRGDKIKPATVNREIALMKAAYNLGMDEKLVTQNPCRKVKMLKENNVRDTVLQAHEFERFCAELTPVARRIIMTAYHTGMRKAEILGLTVDKVNLDGRYIDLDEDDTKDHERRKVFFGDQLYRVIAECLELRKTAGAAHTYLFIRENGQPVKSIRTAFENARKRAKLDNFHFHDLRHTYNTDMRKAGVHDSVIMKQTGHATMEMFLRYNTVDENDCREAIRKRDAYLGKKFVECSLCAPEPSNQIRGHVTC